MKQESRLQKHINFLMKRYPALEVIRNEIIEAHLIMKKYYFVEGKMLIVGNGRSAADNILPENC